MDYSIEKASPADAELIASIVRAGFADVAERFGLTPDSSPTHPSNCTADWISSAMEKGVAYFLLRSGGERLGCVAIEAANEEVCYLERLSVLPHSRRRRYGTALVEHALAQARELGVRRVEIGVIAAQDELREFYRALGFRDKSTARFKHLPFEVAFMSCEL